MSNPINERLRAENTARIESWRNFMDVPVALAIELGRTNLTVKDVLDLEQNSIIQLQRSTAEGVDVVAGTRQLGRGEIIMIEDRTGVRINDIAPSYRARQDQVETDPQEWEAGEETH